MTDWMEAAAEKLKDVGESIAHDVQELLDDAPGAAVISLTDGTSVQVNLAEVDAL